MRSVLLIDPFFKRPPRHNLWFGRPQADEALVAEHIQGGDYVLVSHAHFDHVMDVPAVLRLTGATAYGSLNACRLLRMHGVGPDRARVIRPGDDLGLGSFEVTVHRAQHVRLPFFTAGPLRSDPTPPLRLRDYRMDGCLSFMVRVDGVRILDWGNAQAGPVVPADVLFIGAEWEARFYEQLLGRVRPAVVVTVHWDDFFLPLTQPMQPRYSSPRLAIPPLRRINLAEFRATVGEIQPRPTVLVPDPLRPYDLSALVHDRAAAKG